MGQRKKGKIAQVKNYLLEIESKTHTKVKPKYDLEKFWKLQGENTISLEHEQGRV